MAIEKYATKVAGKKKEDIFMFTLSTCGWCMKTKKLMKELGLEHSYIDVDLMDSDIEEEVFAEFDRWNQERTFPTIVIDKKKVILGFDEKAIRKL